MEPTMILYALGRTTGLAISAGYGATQVMPMYEGYLIDSALFKSTEINQEAACVYFSKILAQEGS